MNHQTFVLFDFDGVIANTFDLCLRAAQVTFPDGNVTAESYRRLFDGNVFEEVQKLHYNNAAVSLDDERQKIFFAHYAREMLDVPPATSMPKVCAALARNHKLIIISSCLNHLLTAYLAKYEFSNLFVGLFGSDVHLSKKEKMRMVFRQFDTTPGSCVFVTDTLGDVKEASEVGLRTITTTWGWHTGHDFTKVKPEAVVHAPAELLTVIQSMFPNV